MERALRFLKAPDTAALAAVILAVLVVGLGAFTRLVDAGLGCPDWPGCYGHLLWPSTEGDLAAAARTFPDDPVIYAKVWPELVHRYLAGLLGLLIAWLAVLSLRRKFELESRLIPLLLLGLVLGQAILGAWTVTLRLLPQVVMAHLLGGFGILCLLWWLWLSLTRQPWHLDQPTAAVSSSWRRLRPVVILTLLASVLQVAMGGWTSANYAALACPDLPLCQGRWWPETDFGAAFQLWQPIGPDYLGGNLDTPARTTIHFSHRLGALAVLGVAGWLIYGLLRWPLPAVARRLGLVLVALLTLQLGLGIANVWLSLPLGVAVAHNLGAAAWLLGLVTVVYHTFARPRAAGVAERRR